jgi:hypothetical protein
MRIQLQRPPKARDCLVVAPEQRQRVRDAGIELE